MKPYTRRNSDLPHEQQASKLRPSVHTGHGASRATRDDFYTPRQNNAARSGFAVSPPISSRTFSVFVGTNATKVLNGDANRRGLLIQNRSASTIFIGIGVQPQTTNGTTINALEVIAGAQFDFSSGYTPINDIYIVSEGQSSHVAVVDSSVVAT